jgi:hypothetical protein
MSDGRIVQAGDGGVARYHSDGSRDDTFGGGAIATFTGTGAVPEFNGVVVLPNEDVVAVGRPKLSTGDGAVLARFSACDCGPCEACDGTGACVAAPQPACNSGGISSLSLRKDTAASRDAVKWKWSRGVRASAQGLGWPHDTTDFAFCIYDESSGNPAIALAASLPASDACGADCWRAIGGTGVASYGDGEAAVGGIDRVKIKTGTDRTNSASASGKGPALSLSLLPVGNATRVQLQAETGECWESFYEADDVALNQGGRFRAKD